MEPTDDDADLAVLEMALAQELGGEAPPDLWPRLQAPGGGRRRAQRWLAAALLLLGVAVVVGVAVLERDARPTAASAPEQRWLETDPQGPQSLAALQTALGSVHRATVQAQRLWSEELRAWVPLLRHPIKGMFESAAGFFQSATHAPLDEEQQAALVASLLAAREGRELRTPVVWEHTIELTFAQGRCTLLVAGATMADPAGASVAFASPRGPIAVDAPAWPVELLRPVLSRCIDATVAARGIVIGARGFDAVPVKVTRLRLHGVPASALPRLLDYAVLRQLDLTDSPEWHTPALLRQFAQRPLTMLAVQGRLLDAEGFAAIASMTGLGELFVTGGGVWDMLMFPRAVPVAPGLDDAALRGLANLQALNELVLCGGTFGDTGLSDLSRLTGLRRLQLIDCRNLTGAGLQAFAGHGLQHLDLRGCGLRPELLGNLAALPELQELRLGSAAADMSLRALPDLGTVSELVLDGRMAAGELAAVARLSGLQKLILRLEPELQDADLAFLHGITRPVDLNIVSSKVTPQGLAALRAALPRCQVRTESW